MGTEGNALAAVNADINPAVSTLQDPLHRAGRYTGPAKDAELFLKDYPAAPALTKGTGGAGRDAGGWVAGQAACGGKTGREAAG